MHATARSEPRSWEYFENGRVFSFQEVGLPPDDAAFERWGAPERLDWLFRQYFALDERVTAGLARLGWDGDAPTLRMRVLGLPLLAMGPPRFESTAERRAYRASLRGGLLLAPGASGGSFGVTLTRERAGMAARLELLDFPLPLGSLWLSRWLYRRTQARLHGWIGRRFLARFRRAWQDPSSGA
jgi:hypothetical protein